MLEAGIETRRSGKYIVTAVRGARLPFTGAKRAYDLLLPNLVKTLQVAVRVLDAFSTAAR